MSNRVNVNINVNDHSRAGLAALRQNMNRMQRDVRRAGGRINFNVRIDPGTSRRDLRRIQRQLRGHPITINTRLDPPSPPVRTTRQRIARLMGAPIRVPVRLTTRGMVGGVRGPLRSLRGLVSGILQDGVGQGIIQGFKAGGPVGVAFLGTLLVSLASVIGAALSGLIITALGAAFVGIAAVSAFKSEEVTNQWTATLQTIKDEFETVGEPLIPVLDRGLERLEKMAKVAGPKLREAVAKTAPATEEFLNKILDSFESFAGEAFDPIMEAWNTFAPIFGEQWNEFMKELGASFADMAKLVKEHPTEIAAALEVVFEALEFLVDTVTFFGKVWASIMQAAVKSTSFVMVTFINMVMSIVESMGAIAHGAALAFQWVPGIGDAMKANDRVFKAFKDNTLERLQSMKDSAEAFGESLDRANRKRKLQADIRSWKADLQTAREKLRQTTSQKARAKLTADISNLKDKVRQARQELNALNGKTAVTYIITHSDTYRSVHDIVGKATGGVRGAATGGARGNLTLVGEQGAELVNLAPGSSVRSNSDTRRMLRNAGGGGGVATVRFEASDGDVNRMLLRIIRRAVRNEGGDFDSGVGIRR